MRLWLHGWVSPRTYILFRGQSNMKQEVVRELWEESLPSNAKIIQFWLNEILLTDYQTTNTCFIPTKNRILSRHGKSRNFKSRRNLTLRVRTSFRTKRISTEEPGATSTRPNGIALSFGSCRDTLKNLGDHRCYRLVNCACVCIYI